jgi:hypothetical protein
MGIYGSGLMEYMAENTTIDGIIEGFYAACDELTNGTLLESYLTEADEEKSGKLGDKVKAIIGKIKEYIKKVFAKIREVFKNFLNNISIKVTKKGEYPLAMFDNNKIAGELNKGSSKMLINNEDDLEKAKEHFSTIFTDIDMSASDDEKFDVFVDNYMTLGKVKIESKEQAEKYKEKVIANYKSTNKILDTLSKLETSFETSIGVTEHTLANTEYTEKVKNIITEIIKMDKEVLSKFMFVTRAITGVRSGKTYSIVLKKLGIKDKDTNEKEEDSAEL